VSKDHEALKQRLSGLTAAQRALLARRLAGEGSDAKVAGEAGAAMPKEPPKRVDADAEGGQTAVYPASNGQERMWFLHHYVPDSPVYCTPAAFHLRGPVQAAMLEAAFHRVIQRHDSLRTTFAMEEGGLVQRVASRSAFRLERAAATQAVGEDRRAAAERRIKNAACLPFDIGAAPPFRAVLAQIEPEEHLLLIVMHHIISDGWSFSNLCRELSGFYAELTGSAPASLPALPVQFADYSAWQRRRLESGAFQEQANYWKSKLAGDLEPLDLPLDRTRPATESFRGGECSLQVDAGLAAALKARAQERSATLFMVLLAAFKVLLHRYTGQTDLLVGVPIANRQRAEVEGLIGFFVNTLVLRTAVSGDETFEEFLGRVKETALEAYEHQDMPFELLVNLLRVRRETSRTPLFQATFALRDFPEVNLQLAGIEVTPWPVSTHTSKFDLSLTVRPNAQGLMAAMEFNSGIFAPESARRMLEHWHAVLLDVAANPARRVSEISLHAPGVKDGTPADWSGARGQKAHYPREACIHQVFERQAARTPDSTALVFKEHQLSYRELNRRANRFANRLLKLGAGPGAPVAVRAERSMEMIVGILGILKAGAAYMPIDTADPAARWHGLLESAGVQFLVSDGRPEEDAPEGVALLDVNAAYQEESDSNPGRIAGPFDPACVFFTSGSTGAPKGVAVPHRAVLRLLLGVDYVQLGPEETLLQMAPMSFDAATFELWGALLHGGRCVLFPERVPTVAMLGETLRRHGVTTLWLTSALFNLVIDEAPEILRNVRQLLAGGESLSVGHVRRALELLPRTRLINGYGPTEGTTFTCCHTIREPPGERARSIPIGRPISNTEVHLLDSRLHPLPAGVPGELYIGGDGLALGYLNLPELTAEKFIASPFAIEPGARLYKTGDLARRLPDGNIEFLGRLDSQVKIRGYRVEPAEIQTALEAHPEVRESAVIAREDTAGSKYLAAYVVPRSDAIPDTPGLRSFLGNRLPGYMVPSVFVILKAMPLTPNGKVDGRALAAVAPEFTKLDAGYAAPSTSSEAIIAGIWREMLGRESIGVDDPFFDVGGHSLLAVRMLARLEAVVGKKVPLATLFAHPTVRALARQMDSGEGLKGSPVIPIWKEGAKPPFFFFYGDVIPGPGFCFELGKRLGDDQPLYAVTPPDLRAYPTYPSLEETAKALIESIRNARPKGPYVLGGYCYGGFVAYEAARQLEALGERVETLILVDAFSPKRPFLRAVRRSIETAGRFAGASQNGQLRVFAFVWTFVSRIDFWLGLRGADKLTYFRLKFSEWLARFRRRQMPAGEHGGNGGPAASPPLPPLRETLIRFQWELAGYTARPYSGRVAFFPSEDAPRHNDNATYGWSEFLAKVEVRPIPGNHGGCVTSHREVFFEKVKACLE
jgi:amino acid adenylation domain-containing protein